MHVDERRTLAEAGRVHFHDPDPSTLSRWVAKGVRGPGGERVRLRATRIGGRLYVSDADAAEFLKQLNVRPASELPNVTATKPKGRTARQRETAIERAERRLQRAG